MLVKTLPVGQLETNCYIVSNEDTLECVVVDPGDEANTILNYIEDNKLKCVAILLTHGHFDHVGAVDAVAEETGATVYMHELDDAKNSSKYMMRYYLPESGKYLKDGDELQLAGLTFHIMATPGHTLGGVTIRCEDALFTGDTLFKGSCGRTDLPGGDLETLMASLRRLDALEEDYTMYPGHSASTKLAREKEYNTFIKKARSAT